MLVRFFSLIVLLILQPVILRAKGFRPSLTFAQVGSGTFGETVFRTEFFLSNETLGIESGSIRFSAPTGGDLSTLLETRWIGQEGALRLEGDEVSFEVPPRSSLALTLGPSEQAYLAWARLMYSGDIRVQCLFQMGRRSSEEVPRFEDLLVREVEIVPLEDSGSWSFPLSFIRSVRNFNTAFALVNLSAVPANVDLTLRGGDSERVQLAPGELFSSYFDGVFSPPLIEIFPLVLEGTIEVRSPAPLGLTVFRTSQGSPVSAVRPVPMENEVEPTPIALGEEFTLKLQEKVRIEGEELVLTFRNIGEDSRCPTGAVCVWEGQAQVSLKVDYQGVRQEDLELISRAGNEELATGEIGETRIRLLDVSPYPNIERPPIEAAEYEIRLVATAKD